MKQHILLLILGCWWMQHSSGQCLPNNNFSAMASCPVVSPYDCPTWAGACNGWNTSHGSPQVGYINQEIPLYYIYMWATASMGEGTYTAFNFQKNHIYDIKIDFITFGQTGTINLYAANGLTEGDLYCGEPVQSNSTKQSIGTYSGLYNNGSSYTFQGFSPNADYSQFWIYPTGSGGDIQPQNEYQLELTDVAICPSCTAAIIYNTGVVPTDESEAGTITAGGPGTVTVNSTASTTFTASSQINLIPNFQAIASSGGSFVARIVPCQNVASMAIPANTLTAVGRSVNMGTNNNTPDSAAGTLSPAAGIKVYPTLTKGPVTITGSVTDLSNASILVTDEGGRTVYKLYNRGGNTLLDLDLGKLGSGLYFLQINNGTKTTTQKIIIEK